MPVTVDQLKLELAQKHYELKIAENKKSAVIPEKVATTDSEDEEGEVTSRDDNLPKCHTCHSKSKKYTCPSCQAISCSLQCINEHKNRTGCTGIRNKTKFVKASQYDVNTLTNDFTFLEDVGRVADNCIRENNHTTRKRKDALSTHARRVDTNLSLMPTGMKKQKLNQSYFHTQSKTIRWTIEWKFPECDVTFLTHTNESSAVIQDLINVHLSDEKGNNTLRQSLQRYCNQTALFVYLKMEGMPANYPQLYACDPSLTLSDVLKYKTVIEFPTFVIHTSPVQ
jgi:hypothetical protein